MASFRWPCASNDLKLATETAARRPQCPADWEEIGKILSAEVSTEQREVKLTGRACRERLDRLIAGLIFLFWAPNGLKEFQKCSLNFL